MFGRGLLVVFASLTALVAPAACSGSSTDGAPDVSDGGARSEGGDGGSAAPAGGGGTAASEAGSSAGGDSGRGGEPSASAGAAGMGGSDAVAAGGSASCDVEVAQQDLAAGTHVATCTAIEHATTPPSSGSHYPIWADFGVYDFPLPRGFWVHNLEHGAVVVSYHCPDGCDDEVAVAADWLEQLSPDASCPNGPPRVLLVPDPELDVRWAASAWGFTLRAPCFDTAAFTDFYLTHAGQPPAPETFVCTTGQDLRAPDAEVCGAR